MSMARCNLRIGNPLLYPFECGVSKRLVRAFSALGFLGAFVPGATLRLPQADIISPFRRNGKVKGNGRGNGDGNGNGKGDATSRRDGNRRFHRTRR